MAFEVESGWCHSLLGWLASAVLFEGGGENVRGPKSRLMFGRNCNITAELGGLAYRRSM